MSRFTIHPSNDPTAMIEFLVRGKENLVRYAVQAESKARLRDDLASLGVSYETLYHSLESLARSIRKDPRIGFRSGQAAALWGRVRLPAIEL